MELFKTKLSGLTVNKKCIIHELTVLAKANENNAEVIVREIQSHIAQIHPEAKLPGLYLIDSIIKNVKGQYTDVFTQSLVAIISDIYQEVDIDTQRKMYKLRKSWKNILPNDLLYKLDIKIRSTFADWPIAATYIITSFKELHSLELQKLDLESKLAATTQLIEKLDSQPVDAEIDEKSIFESFSQLTLPFLESLNGVVKRPAGETTCHEIDAKKMKIKSDSEEWGDDDVIEIVEKAVTIEILDDDDEISKLNVSSSDTNSIAFDEGHTKNARKSLCDSIVEIDDLEEQRIDSTTNDTSEVFQPLKIKIERKNSGYDDDAFDDCFEDIGTFTDITFVADNQVLHSSKSPRKVPLPHAQTMNYSTFATIDGHLHFPKVVTSIDTNKIKINLKSNFAAKTVVNRTKVVPQKKSVKRSNVPADEHSALCSVM